jgi:hypothetical protein
LSPFGNNAIPNGSLRPLAKIWFLDGFEAPSAARNTRMSPASVSATKISPFGATRSTRGLFRPSANKSILKPSGTFGTAERGRGTTREALLADAVAPGFGKSAGVMSLTVPG